ncbi:MAG: hypothetical protein K940chlam3_00007 [Chlamydiae bacterium]|nr:hypothetical protein [Chlamydiota bacterium]
MRTKPDIFFYHRDTEAQRRVIKKNCFSYLCVSVVKNYLGLFEDADTAIKHHFQKVLNFSFSLLGLV